MRNSCVHIYCGGGKGKTTAALGLILRARGAGLNALLVQFLKGTDTSELASLQALEVKVLRAEAGKKFVSQMDESEHAAFAVQQRALFDRAAQAVAAQRYDLVVLDEALDAAELGMLSHTELESLVRARGSCELVLTGRHYWPALASLCHYISELASVKHPYETSRQPARRGIEF